MSSCQSKTLLRPPETIRTSSRVPLPFNQADVQAPSKRACDLLQKIQPRDDLPAFEPRNVRLLRARQCGELDLTHLLLLAKPLHLTSELEPIELGPELRVLHALLHD